MRRTREAVFRLKIDTGGAADVKDLTASLEDCQAAAERTQVKLGQLRKMTYALIRADRDASAAVGDMRASLAGLESSLASAFAPIATVVAPLIADLCDALATAASYVTMFFAVLAGKTTYKRVVSGQNAAAKSIMKTTAASGKLINNLSTLDELHLWDSGSGGRHGGGGSGGSGSGIEFEDVEIPGTVLDWAGEFRAAIEAGDWYGVGELLADKLNAVIERWDARDWGRRLGEKLGAGIDALYGFMSNFSFENVAGKLADMLNGALERIDFSNVGGVFVRFHTAVTDSLIGFFKNLDWGQVTGKLGDFFTGLFNEITAWLGEHDWSALGAALWQKIKDAIAGVDYASLAKSLFTALGTAIRAASQFLGGFFGSIASDIMAWWDQDIQGANWTETAANLLKAIASGFSGVKGWVGENVLQPFMDGILEALGMEGGESGELLMAGGSIGELLLKGIAGKFLDLGGWAKENLIGGVRSALDKAGGLWAGLFGGGEETPGVEVPVKVTGLVDSIPPEQKEIGVRGVFNGTDQSRLPTADKLIEAMAVYTSADGSGLKQNFRDITARAMYYTASGAPLKQSFRDITARALYYSASGKFLGQSYRDINTRSMYTSASWNRFPKAARDIDTVAKYTSANFSGLTNAMRTINTVAKFTSVDKTAVDGKYSLTAKAVLKAGGGVFTAGGWKPVQSFAGGGRPRSGRLFIANENGMPELIGRIGGHTAVMNNGQIVSSVAAGVYRAVATAMGQLGAWFSSMAAALNRLPVALERIELPDVTAALPPELGALLSLPVSYPTPVMATGTVVPPRAVYEESRSGMAQVSRDIRDLKELLSGLMTGRQETPVVVNVSLDGQVDGKNLFRAMQTQARIEKRVTGRDPFAG